MGGRAAQSLEDHLDLTAEERRICGPRSFVGYVRERYSVHVIEDFPRQVPRSAFTRRTIIELAAIALRIGDEFLNVFYRNLVIDKQNVGNIRKAGDRNQVLLEVLGKGLVDTHRNGVMDGAHHERVAVGS